jgi:3-methyladenine DNA glycosylase/8-oxoguanine DNA glycosylase
VLAQVIDDRPDFDPDVFMRRLPAMDPFGALVFQIIGQQISVIAATAIFARLTERFGGRVPDPGDQPLKSEHAFYHSMEELIQVPGAAAQRDRQR